MKNLLLIFLFSLLCLHLHAQQPDSIPASKQEENRIRIDGPGSMNRPFDPSTAPLFILRANGKSYTLPRGSNELSEIDPNWIESIDVIKGQSAMDQYGSDGQHGVVRIQLKKDSVKKLPASLRRRLSGRE
ncbi:MAG: TonB-dependent receptor plug domain-containing protein [Cyclobacteriaceae bacterium]|jgi:hypothetical protein|nr:TonB-dependent receptor plug domain-containing protein [Cyclobacteriaceae bacterium]